MSCFFWGYTITQIVAGSIADRIGGERILNITTLTWSILTFLTPQLIGNLIRPPIGVVVLAFSYWSGYPLFFLLLLRVATGIGQGNNECKN